MGAPDRSTPEQRGAFEETQRANRQLIAVLSATPDRTTQEQP